MFGFNAYIFKIPEKIYKRKMSLNGKNKKTTKVMPKMNIRESNSSGYELINAWNEYENKFYLQKPNGERIYLGTEITE